MLNCCVHYRLRPSCARRPCSHLSAQHALTVSVVMQTHPIRSMSLLQQHSPVCRSSASKPFTSVAKTQLQRPKDRTSRKVQLTRCHSAEKQQDQCSSRTPVLASGAALWLMSALPACAEGTDFSQGSFSKESYYVTLGLFVLSVPGKNCSPQCMQIVLVSHMESSTAVPYAASNKCSTKGFQAELKPTLHCRIVVTNQASTKGKEGSEDFSNTRA